MDEKQNIAETLEQQIDAILDEHGADKVWADLQNTTPNFTATWMWTLLNRICQTPGTRGEGVGLVKTAAAMYCARKFRAERDAALGKPTEPKSSIKDALRQSHDAGGHVWNGIKEKP